MQKSRLGKIGVLRKIEVQRIEEQQAMTGSLVAKQEIILKIYYLLGIPKNIET